MILKFYDLTKILLFLCLIFCFNCDSELEEGLMKSDLSKDVEMVTDFGTIILRLSDDTPIHRNNFIKLVNAKYYDSIAFHRVIENYIIQAGNPTSKPGKTYNGNGNPELNYTIEAEFRPNLFHKRGALGAVRQGGISNPNRSSSGLQFYIVQRGKQTDSTLNASLERVNNFSAEKNVINSPKLSKDIAEYLNLAKKLEPLKEEDLTEEDTVLLKSLRSKINSYNIDSLAKIEVKNMSKYSYPKAHREIYKTLGGAAHLDQNYTVFGEVVQGMDVVDSIAKVETGKRDKPINDIRIISAKMIKRKSYQ